jgi:hypothetical protein
MIQQNYGKYVRDDGDALLKVYVQTAKASVVKEETEIWAKRVRLKGAKSAGLLASPTGFEPVLPA